MVEVKPREIANSQKQVLNVNKKTSLQELSEYSPDLNESTAQQRDGHLINLLEDQSQNHDISHIESNQSKSLVEPPSQP